MNTTLARTVLGADGVVYPAGSTPPPEAGITNPAAWGDDDFGSGFGVDPGLEAREQLLFPHVADPGAAGWRVATGNFTADGRFYYVGDWVHPNVVPLVRTTSLLRMP